MLKLLKFTSHGIHDLDITRGESALRRSAQIALRRCPKSRGAVWLHCTAVCSYDKYGECVRLLLVDSVSEPRTAGCVKQEKLKEVERSVLFI